MCGRRGRASVDFGKALCGGLFRTAKCICCVSELYLLRAKRLVPKALEPLHFYPLYLKSRFLWRSSCSHLSRQGAAVCGAFPARWRKRPHRRTDGVLGRLWPEDGEPRMTGVTSQKHRAEGTAGLCFSRERASPLTVHARLLAAANCLRHLVFRAEAHTHFLLRRYHIEEKSQSNKTHSSDLLCDGGAR